MNVIDEKGYYLNHLLEQASFLRDACESYDKGNFAQAKPVSAIIRTLVKDPDTTNRRSNTVSLLKHLQKKDSMKYYNTGFDAKRTVMNVNLVGIVSVPTKLPTISKQHDNIFLPLLDSSDRIDVKWLSFKDWWESEVAIIETDELKSVFTRQKIVLTMAEKDGGTHIDQHKKIDKEYLDLAAATKSYFYNINPDGKETPVINIHFALVRQIAHELLVSIIKEFDLGINYQPTNAYNLRGVNPKNLKQPGFLVEGEKIESTRTSKPYKLPEGSSFKTPDNAKYVRFFF